MNHNFVTLVPKKDKPQSISDYRPISCANIFYKIISKILCNRLKWFLPVLIAENQFSFIPKKKYWRNVLLAHENIQDLAKCGKPKMCINIDLQKA